MMRIMACRVRISVAGRRSSLLLAGAAIAMPAAALAQQAEDPEPQDIIVTATKRGEQAIQDVPMSIAAIGSDRLKQMGADSFIGWSRSVPGLAVQDQGPGDKKYIIRGIQSVGAATTALYFDEIVMTGNNRQDGGGRQPDPKLYDMERIEVLRGPQGTLYGASSMSGTIRMITNKPKFDRFEGEVDGTVSGTRHGGASFRVNAMINLPVVSDRFAVRGVYYLRDEAGFIDNPLLGLKGINDEHTQGGRLSARLKLGAVTTLTASGMYQQTRSNGRSGYDPLAGDLKFPSYVRIPWKDKIKAFNVTLDHDLGFGSILATSSYFDRDIDYNSDATIIIADLLKRPRESVRSVLTQPQSRSIWSNELRFSSSWDGPFSLISGVYYQKEKSHFTSVVESATALGEPDTSAGRIVYLGRSIDGVIENYSLFGELSYALSDTLTVTGGARWFRFDIVEQSNLLYACCNGNVPGSGLAPKTRSRDSGVNYKFNLSYEPTKDLLLYAQAAQGFRAGGNNELGITNDPSCLKLRAFGSDTLWTYEAGAKLGFAGGRGSFNVTPYYTDWTDAQLRVRDNICNFSYVANAGSIRVLGLEAELAFQPVRGLDLTAGLNFADAEVSRNQSETPPPGTIPGVKGDKVPGQPRFSGNFAAQYGFDIPGADFRGHLRFDYAYVGSSTTAFNRADLVNYRRQPSYSLVNLRAGLGEDDWNAAIFVSNLFDERAEVTRVTSSQRSDIVFTNRPREIGVNVTKRF
ncbi:TonB-dependent receptor [Sphingomonas colocasiae]|uniref:TonB-dependent receptor n=1 Tax=Sphingomonas colocasiae TaxID=1848973 RepID=A0ABS7PTU9_9SPHN|nr:TonB-dependent receptor [Sphingomonas colocasiae]MBY8824769.1 TonB-dependent receptor [Sphingomonas colocasiae]